MDYTSQNKNSDAFQEIFKKKINSNLIQYQNPRAIEEIDQNFKEHSKKDDFDKKEFKYCKEMLLIKSKEEVLKQRLPRNFLNKKNKVFLMEKMSSQKMVLDFPLDFFLFQFFLLENRREKFSNE
jgi:hypothetical protein